MGPSQWRWHWHVGEWLEGALPGAVMTVNEAPGGGTLPGLRRASWSVTLHKVSDPPFRFCRIRQMLQKQVPRKYQMAKAPERVYEAKLTGCAGARGWCREPLASDTAMASDVWMVRGNGVPGRFLRKMAELATCRRLCSPDFASVDWTFLTRFWCGDLF